MLSRKTLRFRLYTFKLSQALNYIFTPFWVHARTICHIILLSLVAGVAWRAGENCGVKRGVADAKQYLPTQRQIQQMLVARGQDIGQHGVDGVIDDDTRTAWDNAVADEQFKDKFTITKYGK